MVPTLDDLITGNGERGDLDLPAIDDIFDDAKEGENQKSEETTGDEIISSNRSLRKECGSRAVDYVGRLHKNLVHPSAATLLRMLG